MYADTVTDAMREAIDETERRRKIQSDYNEKHNIKPKTVKKAVREVIKTVKETKDTGKKDKNILEKLENEMKKAASELRFEDAAKLRDRIERIRGEIDEK